MFHKEKRKYKAEISCEQFLTGALLKFQKLNSVDFCLLREDFESRANVRIKGL